ADPAAHAGPEREWTRMPTAPRPSLGIEPEPPPCCKLLHSAHAVREPAASRRDGYRSPRTRASRSALLPPRDGANRGHRDAHFVRHFDRSFRLQAQETFNAAVSRLLDARAPEALLRGGAAAEPPARARSLPRRRADRGRFRLPAHRNRQRGVGGNRCSRARRADRVRGEAPTIRSE